MKEKLYVGLKGELKEVPNDWYHNQGTWILNAVLTLFLMAILVSLIATNGGILEVITKLVTRIIH